METRIINAMYYYFNRMEKLVDISVFASVSDVGIFYKDLCKSCHFGTPSTVFFCERHHGTINLYHTNCMCITFWEWLIYYIQWSIILFLRIRSYSPCQSEFLDLFLFCHTPFDKHLSNLWSPHFFKGCRFKNNNFWLTCRPISLWQVFTTLLSQA